MTAYGWFRRAGLLKKATKWLGRNPPPPNWQGTNLDWAYTEMPLWPWEHWRARHVPKPKFDA